jgi:hypothetical protein
MIDAMMFFGLQESTALTGEQLMSFSSMRRAPVRRPWRWLRAAIVLFMGLPVTACVTTSFTQPIASFQQSVNSSSASLGTYFTELNSLERAVYFEDLATDPSKRLEAIDKDGNRTALTGQIFTADAVKARMNALSLLGIYAQRLAELAGSDPGAQFEKNVNALGTSLSNLGETFTQLATPPAAGQKAKDPKAAQYAGPISALVGTIGKMYLDSKRDEMIAEAVNKGSPQVNNILDLLEADLTSVVLPLVNVDLKVELGDAVQDYNNRAKSLNTEQRATLLAAIGLRADAYYAAVEANPIALIQAIRTANAALVKYANAPKTPENFTQFLSALQAMAQSAQDVANDVNKIKAVH